MQLTHTGSRVDPKSTSRWIQSFADRVNHAGGRPDRLHRVMGRSPVPMIMVDHKRRYVEVNAPARLVFRLSLAELRTRRIEDLSPPEIAETELVAAWSRLMDAGRTGGPYIIASPHADSQVHVSYHGVAETLPGLHVIAFAPSDWPEGDLLGDVGVIDDAPQSTLTRRELEVLELAAAGRTGPMIADELVLSAATVRTHFEHIYAKLEVGDRAAAVAKAMRLGLIA